jgi:hypothetical protein
MIALFAAMVVAALVIKEDLGAGFDLVPSEF